MSITTDSVTWEAHTGWYEKSLTNPNHYQQQALPPPQMPAAQPVTLLRKSTLHNSNVSNHYQHKMLYWRKRSVFYPINVRK
jgi:hypothetical protein